MNSLRAYLMQGRIEAGCDEAGRGCLAGPVVAAAVILPPDWDHPLLQDSKKMTEEAREEVKLAIVENAIAWKIGLCSPLEIDQINILKASILAMHRALDQLDLEPDHILVDGNRFQNWRSVPSSCIIKGDGIYRSIAAASVIAKTYRDELMKRLHEEFPHYAWNQNKGYPTAFHRKQVLTIGMSPQHRITFRVSDPDLKGVIFD